MNAEVKITGSSGTDARPASAVSGGVGWAGLAGLGLWFAASRTWGFDGADAALIGLLACAIPMLAWSLWVDRVHLSLTTGIDWSLRRPAAETHETSIVKLVGLWTIWAGTGFFYCVGRWYWSGNYLYSMQLLGMAAIPMLLGSIPYVFWLDRHLRDPRDGAWHFGRLVIGRPSGVDRGKAWDFVLAWIVKGFFLAFMISIVPGNWADAVRPTIGEIIGDPVGLARWLIAAMFMVDVCFATVGYAMTFKPLDAHIRSANPYAAGWMAALICYPPFILMSPGGPLDYHSGLGDWTLWLEGHPAMLAAFGAALVVLTAVYAWATVVFGIRFSNLTNRGIITHGPYAWTKHPAYVSKNLFWWVGSMPFLAASGNPTDAVRNTVVLGLVTGVYYWRARTEERHLMADPAYQEYAAWMERHGPLPRLLRGVKSRLRGPSDAPHPAE